MLAQTNLCRLATLILWKSLLTHDNRSAIQNLGEEVQQGNQQLTAAIRTGVQAITTSIPQSVEEPWDQKPIRFQDGLGRRYPLAVEICVEFAVSTSYINSWINLMR
jgi:hypothetical protein